MADTEQLNELSLEVKHLHATQNIHLFKDFYANATDGFGELELLCDEYGSDKGSQHIYASHAYSWIPHTYTQIYNYLFAPIRKDVKFLFECGVGTNNENLISNMGMRYKPGASLRVWRDYFKNIECVYGADIDKDILFFEDKIKTYYLDQTDKDSIFDYFKNIDNKNEYFDIMIDDGLHEAHAAISLFENSIRYLKNDGFYVIEDLALTSIHILHHYLKKYPKFETNYVVMGDKGYLGNNNLIVVKKH